MKTAPDIAKHENDHARWTTFMVYGGGRDDPETGLNFFILRMPAGRQPWSKKIVPAIRAIIRARFTAAELRQAAERKHFRGEDDLYWNVEGEPEPGSYWTLRKSRPTRYLWDGSALVKWPYEVG